MKECLSNMDLSPTTYLKLAQIFLHSIVFCTAHIPQAHMATCKYSISNAVQKEPVNSTGFTPKKNMCRMLLNLKQKKKSRGKILQKKYNIMLEPLTNLMNFFLSLELISVAQLKLSSFEDSLRCGHGMRSDTH